MQRTVVKEGRPKSWLGGLGAGLLAVCVVLSSARSLGAREEAGPVYRWTDRLTATAGDERLRVFARASTPQRVVVQHREWFGLIDLEAARVEWYPSATAVAREVRLTGVATVSGNAWVQDGRADVLSPAGDPLTMRTRHPVEGRLTRAALLEMLPAYEAAAADYAPRPDWLKRLRERVRELPNRTSLVVVFGSWCVACETTVPRLAALFSLVDLPVEFLGVGPTSGDTRDPAVESLAVHRLPTLLLLSEGKEVARLEAIDDLRRPERGLTQLLSGWLASPEGPGESPSKR
ncbi:MAG: thioredoxin family protein [Acidobacteriota bacterium]